MSDTLRSPESEELEANKVRFINAAGSDVFLLIEFHTTFGITNTVIGHGAFEDIVFDGATATFCHRTEGPYNSPCPALSLTAKAGDVFKLKANGASEKQP